MNDRELLELESRVAEAERILAEARAKLDALKAEKKPARWKPASNERYHSSIWESSSAKWDGFTFDQRTYAMGDVFPTQAETDAEYERRCVLARMRDIAAEAGAVGDQWWNIEYRNDGPLYVNGYMAVHTPGAVRFPTRESAERAIAELGEMLMVLL